ncbi:MAG: hypothetical protein K6E13_11620 [Lachnospiraceae bacterium]|nr:hypothetical protein [Lachnospiraceae bacterium]
MKTKILLAGLLGLLLGSINFETVFATATPKTENEETIVTGETPGTSVGNIKAEAVSVETGIYLSWEEVYGATAYKICKFVNGKFVVLSELDSDVFHYNDTDVEDGVEYIYGIIADYADSETSVNINEDPGGGGDRYKILIVTYNEKESNEVTLDEDNSTAKLTMEETPKKEDKTFDNSISSSNDNSSEDDSEILEKTAEMISNLTGGKDKNEEEKAADPFDTLVNYRMENSAADMVIEADVSLSGTGSGYHAKIVMGTAQSAVSFGIQYDEGASAPYTGKTMALLENIQTNYNGEQQYVRFAELERNRTYRLMLTLNGNGHGEAYVNGQKVGSFENPYVVSSGNIDLWVEGAARLSGDSVNAVFSNVRARKNGVTVYGATGEIVDDSTRHNGISVKTSYGVNSLTKEAVTMNIISGTVHGIGDWDSSFNNASSMVHVKFD